MKMDHLIMMTWLKVEELRKSLALEWKVLLWFFKVEEWMKNEWMDGAFMYVQELVNWFSSSESWLGCQGLSSIQVCNDATSFYLMIVLFKDLHSGRKLLKKVSNISSSKFWTLVNLNFVFVHLKSHLLNLLKKLNSAQKWDILGDTFKHFGEYTKLQLQFQSNAQPRNFGVRWKKFTTFLREMLPWFLHHKLEGYQSNWVCRVD